MPIYDYVCTQCEHEFIEWVASWDDEKQYTASCPKCKKEAKKVPSVNAQMKQNWSQWNAMG